MKYLLLMYTDPAKASTVDTAEAQQEWVAFMK